jgi:16S rRNA (guanine1207-N2)-methyltransferase
MPADELVFDPGVLGDGPLCELLGWQAAARLGATAVLPWRAAWLAARHAGVEGVDRSDGLDSGAYAQCLVHLQKSRPGTWHDLAEAWRLLRPGGRLLLCGGNDLGVVSAVKRLGRELAQHPVVVANRRRARVVLFRRDDGAGPERPDTRSVSLTRGGDESFALRAEPGVFSTKRLDAGTELLLSALAGQATPERILDLGCGIGPLGLAALRHWPGARALLLDGDARAVRSARGNAVALGVDERCRVEWWDADEPCPDATESFDLALLNPPFHTGKAVDLRPARGMFRCLGEVLGRGGSALVVANRTLPYEADLSELGSLRLVVETGGFKLLALKRRSRSASSRTRKRPGARSSGRA